MHVYADTDTPSKSEILTGEQCKRDKNLISGPILMNGYKTDNLLTKIFLF